MSTKITYLDKDDKTHRFLIEDIDITNLNVLRRKIGYCLSVYAIDEVDFYENDSVVVDEMLANRLALCPLSTPENTTGKKVTLSLEKTGPCTVYSGDLKSNDADIKPIYDTIPLTKLKENQNLRFDAYALQGEGRTHVKFSPAIVSYKILPELELLRGCDGCELCVKACPVNCMKIVSGKPKIDDVTKCINCQACVDACPKECVKLNDTRNYILTVELIGQMDISTILKLLDRYSKEYFMLLKKKFK
jgi:DNA-directed RNA polymerase subunit D